MLSGRANKTTEGMGERDITHHVSWPRGLVAKLLAPEVRTEAGSLKLEA